MVTERTTARAIFAIVGLDVVPFRALCIVVMHGFPGTG